MEKPIDKQETTHQLGQKYTIVKIKDIEISSSELDPQEVCDLIVEILQEKTIASYLNAPTTHDVEDVIGLGMAYVGCMVMTFMMVLQFVYKIDISLLIYRLCFIFCLVLFLLNIKYFSRAIDKMVRFMKDYFNKLFLS